MADYVKKDISCSIDIGYPYAGGAAAYHHYFLSGPGMVLPFSGVAAFSRSEEFVASFPKNRILEGEVLGSPWYSGSPNWTRNEMTVCPNANGFYTCEESVLIQYDASGNIVRELTVEDFNLDAEEAIFCRILGIADDRLWVEIGRRNPRDPIRYTVFTLEWLFCDEPAKAVVKNLYAVSMAADSQNRPRL